MRKLEVNKMQNLKAGNGNLACFTAGVGVAAIFFEPELAPALGNYTATAAAACIAS